MTYDHRSSGNKFKIRPLHFCCLSAMALTGMLPSTSFAQDTGLVLEEVIVTAQRREEALQDVPISMTVFDQSQLDARQINDVSDLAQYVPGLSVDTTFGRNLGSFTIRGFAREARTTAAVAVYFADAVAPRGNTSQYSGDGAGPGSFFDLQNVQVLRGPQGTLFGRNTTGGAVLLVPQRPTDEFGGYAMGGIGNYDMYRAQGVLNLPVADSLRLRFGVDHQVRDGVIENLGERGPDYFDDVNYTSFRASMVWDIADNIENYTIFTDQSSDTEGDLPIMYDGTTASATLDFLLAGAVVAQGERFQQAGKWYAGENGSGDPGSEFDQWRVINTTRWDVTDSFTVKNIASYSSLETALTQAIFGSSWVLPGSLGAPAAGKIAASATSYSPRNGLTTDHVAWSEELQFLGETGNLTWQAGLYYEETSNDGLMGSLSASNVDCGLDPRDLQCFDALFAASGLAPGSLSVTPAYVEYENFGAYAQGSYSFTDQFALTLGVRYTDDKVNSYAQPYSYTLFPVDDYGDPQIARCQEGTSPNQIPAGVTDYREIINSNYCVEKNTNSSDAPTWLVNLDYHLTDDILLYGKYVRGYRQASLNPSAPTGFEAFDAEKVDMFEIGAKTEFGGPVPGRFNIAIFDNDFTDQQINVGYVANPTAGVPSTSGIINAGASTIRGAEVEATLLPHELFRIDISYGYLDTNLDQLDTVENPDPALYLLVLPQAEQGGPLPRAPEHKYSITGSYSLPLSADLGAFNIAATYSYTDEISVGPGRPIIDDYDIVNVNANWNSVLGSPLDLALFVTNATDEEYVINEGSQSLGANRRVGLPRMYGMTLRYNFGGFAD